MAQETMTFRLNGRTVTTRRPLETRLLDFIRDDSGLTGTKEGCGSGVCGTCTVLVDGRAVNACQVQLKHISGKEVLTIEGLENQLARKIKDALVRVSAPQCGFCTPAMVLRIYALVQATPRPSHAEIVKALKPVLCRCTGYIQYIKAVQLVTGAIQEDEIDSDLEIVSSERVPDRSGHHETRFIGHSLSRQNVAELMNGQALFADDYRPASVIYGAVVTSPWPSARIVSIDKQSIAEEDGLIAVLTAADVPGKNLYGKVIRDREMLCQDRVRMVGDPVALVLSDSEQTARQLASLLVVHYEPLEPVLTVDQALAPDAIPVHTEGNLLSHLTIRKGESGPFFNGDFPVLEAEYQTARVDQCPLELESSLAFWKNDIMTIIAPTQHVFFDRLNIARVLGLKQDQVRVIQPHVGGSFGKREDVHTQLFAALGCLKTGKAVKVRFNREESLGLTTKRHPFVIRLKTAFDPETGKILAQDVDLTADGGAYASWSKNVLRKAAVHCCGPYSIDHVRVEARVVYTNNPVSGAMRGFGAPQVTFAMESQLDRIAELCRLRPLEIRRKNMLHKGLTTITGQRLLFDFPVRDTLTLTEKKIEKCHALTANKTATAPLMYGTGFASFYYGIGFGAGIKDEGKAIIRFKREGVFELRTGVVDYGQGANTIGCQIAAEVLGMPQEYFVVHPADTHQTPNSGSSVASRQTFITGNAILRAAHDLRNKLFNVVGTHLGVSPGTLYFEEDGIVSPTTLTRLSFGEIFTIALQSDVELLGVGEFKGHDFTTQLDEDTGQGKAYYPFTFGTQCARVSVDPRTGEVQVMNIIATHYIGKALNPGLVKGQIFGAIVMGIGYALKEHITVERGRVIQRSLADYHLPRVHEIPDIRIILLEDTTFPGPFGAVGIGEPPLVPTAPAIANAIYDAVGFRALSLPISSKDIHLFLSQKDQRT